MFQNLNTLKERDGLTIVAEQKIIVPASNHTLIVQPTAILLPVLYLLILEFYIQVFFTPLYDLQK
jgi:hypothetical protein